MPAKNISRQQTEAVRPPKTSGTNQREEGGPACHCLAALGQTVRRRVGSPLALLLRGLRSSSTPGSHSRIKLGHLAHDTSCRSEIRRVIVTSRFFRVPTGSRPCIVQWEMPSATGERLRSPVLLEATGSPKPTPVTPNIHPFFSFAAVRQWRTACLESSFGMETS